MNVGRPERTLRLAPNLNTPYAGITRIRSQGSMAKRAILSAGYHRLPWSLNRPKRLGLFKCEARPQTALATPVQGISAASSPLATCSLFSACGHTMLCFPSSTSSVISWPRCAGRQCITWAPCFAC